MTKDESDMLLAYLFNVSRVSIGVLHVLANRKPQLVTQNHDAQVRFKWRKNDLAIWDNRSNWHCATYDYEAARAGDRVASLGEAPFLDTRSTSRRAALAARA